MKNIPVRANMQPRRIKMYINKGSLILTQPNAAKKDVNTLAGNWMKKYREKILLFTTHAEEEILCAFIPVKSL